MKDIVREICNYILENINNEIKLEQIEEEFYYNKFYLIRAFKQYSGYTIKEFINKVKVLKTIDPLIFTDDTILKIALNNGFNSQEYYSEKFKDEIGMSPLKFRKQYQGINETENIEDLKLKREYLVYLNRIKYELLNMPNGLSQTGCAKKLEKVS